MDYTYGDIAKMIDHSLLSPAMTTSEFEAGIQLGLAYDVASICIMPYYLGRTAELLRDSSVQASTVIGFPHGGHATATKVTEAETAIADGGQELDMVVNISQVLSGEWEAVRSDIRAVVEVAHASGQRVKVIFENCYLDESQKIKLCELCSELGADWVKTSTGFGTGGATLEDLELMRRHAAPQVQVKASGGVRDLDTVLAARALGVTRVGASRTKPMLDDCRERLGLPPLAAAGGSAASEY